MSFATPLIEALGETAYLLNRSLGARNAVTGVSTVSYVGSFDEDDFECVDFDCATSINIMMNLSQTNTGSLSAGAVTNEVQRGYVSGTVDVEYMDLIEYHDTQYVVDSVTVPKYHLDEAGYKQVNLVRIDE